MRLAAHCIDALISGAIGVAALIPISLVCGILPENIGAEPILFNYTLSVILSYCVKAGYFILFTYTTGRTLGKRALNLRVINADGSRQLSLLNVIFRETIGKFLSGIMWIGYFMIGIDDYKRSLHDRLCDTLVVYEKEIVIHEVRKAAVSYDIPPVSAPVPEPGTGFGLVKPEETNTERLENKSEDQ